MSRQIFKGIRILDLSRVLSGPFASMMLGDLGADVWKIEPAAGDPTRHLAPPCISGVSAYYLAINRNKSGLCMDFRSPEAPAILRKLAGEADVVLENFLPAVKRELGIDYASVVADNPDVVYCSISGFGQRGPHADRPGLDNIFQGMAGLMSVTGEGDAPVKAGERLGDVIAGLNAAYAISSALYARERTGQGQYIELALVDCLIAAQAPMISHYFATGEQPPRTGNGSQYSAPTGTFKTRDKPINLCVLTDKHWKALCDAIGRPGMAADPRFATIEKRIAASDELDRLIGECFETGHADEWLDTLARAGVPAGPVYTYEEVFADPQVRHNGMRIETEHPELGSLSSIGFPVRYSETPCQYRNGAPLLGQHGERILEAAGFEAREIRRLSEQGVVRLPGQDD